MAQPNLGDREYIPARFPKELNLKEAAREAGYRYTNRYLADFVSIQMGRPDLIIGPDFPGQEQLTA